MSKRERILVILICVMGGLLLVRTGVTSYRGGLVERDRIIENKEGEVRRLELEVEKEKVARREWIQIGEQTLSQNPNEIVNLMREELFRLAEASGLQDVTVNPGRIDRAWQRTEVLALRPSVRGEGTLDQILKFMYALYRQPYLIRCRTVTVTPEDARGREPQRRTTGRLQLDLELETLILPSSPGYPSFTPVQADEERRGQEVEGRLQLASLEEYRERIPAELFSVYVPPPPPPAKATGPNPPHGGQVQEGRVVLRWQGGERAQRHIVHWGDSNPPPPVTTQPATAYSVPEQLPAGNIYYWRIDGIGESGTTTGDVWMFRTVEKAEPQPTPEPEPPPPADCHLVLGRVLGWPGRQQAVLEDPQNRNAPDKRVELGEAMCGGLLIMVHRRGAISELPDGSRRVHPIGQPLNQARPLTEADFPEVYHELRQLEQRAEGISQRPG